MHVTHWTRCMVGAVFTMGHGPWALWFLLPCCWTRVQKPFHSPQCLKMGRAVGSEEGAKAAGLARGPGGLPPVGCVAGWPGEDGALLGELCPPKPLHVPSPLPTCRQHNSVLMPFQ